MSWSICWAAPWPSTLKTNSCAGFLECVTKSPRKARKPCNSSRADERAKVSRAHDTGSNGSLYSFLPEIAALFKRFKDSSAAESIHQLRSYGLRKINGTAQLSRLVDRSQHRIYRGMLSLTLELKRRSFDRSGIPCQRL